MTSLDHFAPEESGQATGLPPLAPNFIEQDYPEEIDDIIPTRGYHMVPMVGLGGSAGSIPALIRFFTVMPADSGMVFVVVLHLSPNHESTLPELLARTTTMPVHQAVDGQKVETNHVYVIPPGKYIATVDGHLKLVDLKAEWGKRTAVDLFARSLILMVRTRQPSSCRGRMVTAPLVSNASRSVAV